MGDSASQRLLEQMLEDMVAADPLYRPTRYWQRGVHEIASDLRRLGFSEFRSHPSARWYAAGYAPPWYRDYGRFVRPFFDLVDTCSGRRKLGERWRRIIEGRPRAERDYDVLVASDDGRPPRLTGIGESDVGRPAERVVVSGVPVGKSFLNYLRGLSFLKRHADLSSMPRVLEIGGGFGSLGEILLRTNDRAFYLDVDMPPIAAVATHYLREIFGHDAVFDYEQGRAQGRIDIDEIARHHRAAVLCPWQLPRTSGQVDLFVNFISFQEMEPHVVRNYVHEVSRLAPRHVLLRNSRHGMPRARTDSDIGVGEPTRMEDVIRMFADFRIVARDAGAFCDKTWDGSRVSELACLVRA